MNYTVYRVKSKRFTGMLFLKYKDGKLTEAVFPEEVADEDLMLPTTEQHLLSTSSPFGGARGGVQPIQMRTAREKVIAFCTAYKYYRKQHYLPKDREKSNIKHVPVSKELLDVFFTTPFLQHFTIDNYISRINITRDWAKNGIPDGKLKSRHPDHYDADHERKLTGQELQDYYRHLTSLGYVKDYHPTRGTIWKEKRLDT